MVDGRVASVRFRNVPAFVWATGVRAVGVEVDVAFGGAFYASCRERVEPRELPRLIELGRALKRELEAEHEIVHPLEPELRDVYGVVFWQPEPGDGLTQRNVTVFADGEVDRSPCGSGTSARLALLDAAGELAAGDELCHLSIIGSRFSGRVVGRTESRAARPSSRRSPAAPTGRASRASSSTRTTDWGPGFSCAEAGPRSAGGVGDRAVGRGGTRPGRRVRRAARGRPGATAASAG